jgi:acetyl esterase/lipase
VYVNLHGGGFVIGRREQDDPWCRYLAAHARVVVINLDYLLAPRHRFPVPVEQIYDVLQWACADEREWAPSPLCIGGQSAGGNLAAGAARLALAHRTPTLALQVLHYAPLDLATPAKYKTSTVGRKAVMHPWMREIFDTAYLPDHSLRRHPLASPAWGDDGDDLRGIAPAVVIAAEYDRLRAEAARYAEKLAVWGVPADYRVVPAVDHAYNIMGDSVCATRDTYAFIVDHVIRALSARC